MKKDEDGVPTSPTQVGTFESPWRLTMLTGKQLRSARTKKNLSAEKVAKGVGISVNTLYAWEASKEVSPRDERKLAKLLDIIGFKRSRGLVSEAEKKPRKGLPKALAVTASPIPPGATTVAEGAGGSGKNGRADVAELTSMLGFFMGDQARRSNLGHLLKAALRCGLTIHDLDRAVEGNG